jgi:hypothetical protein
MFAMRQLLCRAALTLSLMLLPLLLTPQAHGEAIILARDGQAKAAVFVNTTGAGGENASVLTAAGERLAQNLGKGLGSPWPTVQQLTDAPAIVIARADQYPDIAAQAKLDTTHLDAFCIVSSASRLYLLGTTEVAAQHAVVTLLHDLGYRVYNPLEKWWITPSLRDLSVDTARSERPAMLGRSMWYAYGEPLDHLKAGYEQWRVHNRLVQAAPFQNGHSYGNIIGRNQKVFDEHPEYYALKEDGKRQSDGAVAARKLCYSNPDLIKLVIADRVALLRENRQANPYAFMVSVDPSDGQGTCHCENCKALGTETDRVIHLANAVARALQQEAPPAWVGLYAYSSHRLPPTISVEPNVNVQVAMGFNRTEYTLEELIGLWAQKVTSVGLREYYSVEEWDFGLPGRMRGADVAYHQKWIPFYAQRNVNAINSQINANWGGQTLGLYVAARLMWKPGEDVEAITAEFFRLCFGDAAEPMRRLHARFDEAGELSAFTLAPMFDDLHQAFAASSDPAVRARLIDLMAYLVYVDEFQTFKSAEARDAKHGDVYYTALGRLMRYAWQIRQRGIVHSYALARRLTNGLPLNDGRFEYWMNLSEKNRPPQKFLDQHKVKADDLPPRAVWVEETQLSDDEITRRFDEARVRLAKLATARVSFDDALKAVTIPGDQAGAAQAFNVDQPGSMRVRRGMVARLIVDQPRKFTFRVTADSRSSELTLLAPDGAVIAQRQVGRDEGEQAIDADCKAGEHLLRITGDFLLVVPPDTRLVIEASPQNRFHAEYSGGQFFYVPRGTRQVRLNVAGRLCLLIPGKGRVDLSEQDQDPELGYIVLDVPKGADGAVWQTFHQTRGTFYFVNIPPWIMPFRNQMAVPLDLAKKENLR